MDRRRFLASAAALSLAGCGGGGSSTVQYIGGPPAKYRPGILYGYFGDGPESAAQTGDHANLYMSAPWWGEAEFAITAITKAKAAGFTDLVVMPRAQLPDGRGGWLWGSVEQTVEAIYTYMAKLAAAGALDDIALRGIYWCDEPNTMDEGFVRGVNRMLRPLTSAPLWTIFADAPGRPGLDEAGDPAGAWDGVAIDQYDIGCSVLGGLNDELKRRMKPGARRFIVPGPVGGHLSQVDPACFENFAYANPDVMAIVTFTWPNGWGGVPTNLGLAGLPALAATYRALGKRITARI